MRDRGTVSMYHIHHVIHTDTDTDTHTASSLLACVIYS
jgi:hypothetical protein